jgi:predicted amidohydrolase
MSRVIRVVTTSLATLEDTAPPYNLRHPSPDDNLELGLSMLKAAGAQGADLVCLPEGFAAAGLPLERVASVAEAIPGPIFDAVAEQARHYGMYVVAGFYTRQDERIYNVAALIDRAGNLVGTYAKNYPTEQEIDCGVTPGSEVVVLDTDFGRVGLAVCFDLNWQPFWAGLAEQGAELVCWISAYEGGFPLQAFAWLHQYPIVTSVWPYHARVIDITGRILTSTSRWGRIATCDLNLDKRLFHTDLQSGKLLAIQTRYGERICLETFTEEHLFTLESSDPDLSIDQVIAEFGLVDYQSYINRCTTVREQAQVSSAT